MSATANLRTARIEVGDDGAELPLLRPTIGPAMVDLRRLYQDTGCYAYDPALHEIGVCRSGITFVDADEGILLYRGYPIDALVESCSYLVDEYLIEGVGFMPRHVAALDDRIEIRPVFVGMKHVQLDSVLAMEGRNRWHRDLDEPTLAAVPRWIESWSEEIEMECVQLSLPYVELSDDFLTGIDTARRLLLGSGETARST